MDLRFVGFVCALLVAPQAFAKPPVLDNRDAERMRERGGRVSGAKFLSQVVPMVMDAGKTYSVAIQFRNTSGENWSRNNGQKLVARTANAARVWGTATVEMDGGRNIVPDNTATFHFDVTAPTQSGTHDFQWQVANANGETLGEPTPVLKIVVNPSHARGNANAEFVTQQVPGMNQTTPRFAIWERGRPYKISVMFKNNGSAPWNAPAFRLAAQNPAQNLTWSLDHVELGTDDNIKSGQFKSYNFTVISPVEPGIYALQWQMYREGIGFFGEPSESIAVTVK